MEYTVKGLISELRKFNPDATVYVSSSRMKPSSNILDITYLPKVYVTEEDIRSGDVFDKKGVWIK